MSLSPVKLMLLPRPPIVPLEQNLPAISGKAFKKLQRVGVPETFSPAFLQQHGLAQITIETDRGRLTIIALAEERQITTVHCEGQLYKTSIYPDGREILPPPVISPPQVQPCEEVLAEHQRFLALLEECPPAMRSRYVSEADEALRNPHEAPRITQLRGVIFRLTRTLDIERQGLETTDYSRAQTDPVKHLGYSRKETDFSHPPTEDCESEIKIDIPLVREGGIYAYLVKVSPRTPFGRDAGARNQMLRLQAAIAQKRIAGATVEIKGRIDRSFLAWAAGTSPIDPGAVPDVEIIYTFELSSGAEYRFPLKRSRENHGVKFEPANTWYTPEDREIIQGIHLALQDVNKPIIDIITGATVIDPSDPLREILETKGPTGILTLELFHEYETKRLQTIWQMLLKQSPAVNTENERNVRHIFETCQNPAEVRRYVEAGVKEFMQFLQNEAIAQKKRVRPIEDPAKLTVLIDDICDRINFIWEREQSLRTSATEVERRIAEDGFVGKPEGIALPFNFVIIDAMRYMQSMERGSQKVVYSYRNPERFKELPAALTAVAKEDRYYREVTVSEPYGLIEPRDFAHFDKPKAKLDILRRAGFLDKEGVIQPSFPSDFESFFAALITTTRGEVKVEERNVWAEAFQILQRGSARKTYTLANPSAEVVERVHGEMVHETIRRADAIVQQLKRRQDILEQQAGRTEEEQRELGQLNRRLTNYKRIERVQGEIKRLTAQKIEQLRSSPREKATILATFGEEIAKQQEELIVLIPQYKMVLGGEGEWEKIEKRIVKDEQQNLIKFIYVVTADGRIIVDEEKVRGVVSSRAAHSELAQGGNVYGAGELIFSKDPASGEWVLTEINNGSGHYRPSQATLPYVKKLIERSGISTQQANLEDSILRGGPVLEIQ